MNKPGRRSFTFEFKLGVVRRFVDGEATAPELARARPVLVQAGRELGAGVSA
jgi:transposase-like protein